MAAAHSHRPVRRDGEDGERVMVAAPRGPKQVQRADDRAQGTWAGDAGLTLIVVIAVVAATGALIGRSFDVSAAGALIGGFVGVVAGFAGIYHRYHDL